MESLLRQIGVALFAGEFCAEMGGAALGGEDPRAEGPRWVVADMLSVAAVEVGDPVADLILVESNDLSEEGHRRFDYRGR